MRQSVRIVRLVLFLAALTTPRSRYADFPSVQPTQSRVSVSIGTKDNEGWTTEGWWNVGKRRITCETLMRGPLVARFY